MDLTDISLTSLSLDSSANADIVCGSTGLPLTPNSVRIIGDFKAIIEKVDHPNLIKYVECFRNKNERVTLVFEHLPSCPPDDLDFRSVAAQILSGLDYLHNNIGYVHGILTDECILWSGDKPKIAHWPINSITCNGYALGAERLFSRHLSYLAPELVKNPKKLATKSSDIWSAGLILLKLMQPNCRLPENPCRLAFCENIDQLFNQIEVCFDDEPEKIDGVNWRQFFTHALDLDPSNRATIDELCSIISHERQVSSTNLDANFYIKNKDEISKLNISEIYYLWRLSLGRNLESEQKQDDCPPIFKIPYLIVTTTDKQVCQEMKLKPYTTVDTNSRSIPLEKFKNDIKKIDEKIFHPFCLTEVQSKVREVLPIVIKEADFVYQCERIVLFKRLIGCCPYVRDRLKREASVDIPPYYRAKAWAILLGVNGERSRILYESIDKTTPIATDRQISVDIPRCHQYNELMASPQGHQKLARILKAWLNYNSTEYVYWQGLDSLAAPFLLLNFDNEALAFSSLNAFINKYLRGFFKKDNQIIVQQYLSMFSELLSYHDASLASHLESLGFLPNLYAIPWFLTMFTHVLPLHKVLHVWDCLLLGDERFPLCIGLAILNQLRRDLLEYNFNDCIVAFSDLPEIDIERCITDASHFYNSTPDKLIELSEIRDFHNQSW